MTSAKEAGIQSKTSANILHFCSHSPNNICYVCFTRVLESWPLGLMLLFEELIWIVSHSTTYCKYWTVLSISDELCLTGNVNHNHFLGIFSRRQIDDTFSYFSFPEISFDISCTLSRLHGMSKPIFWKKKKKKKKKKCFKMSSAEIFIQSAMPLHAIKTESIMFEIYFENITANEKPYKDFY